MMSRLAVYPLIGAAVLFLGRRNVSRTHLFLGSAFSLLPAISLLWSTSPCGGVPFAVRWFSFGIMVIGFSGSVAERGLKSHLIGLSAAAAVTSVVMLLFGADTLTGNPNRTGMILALGFTASVAGMNRAKRFSWFLPPVILAGAVYSSFVIGWAACLLGSITFLIRKRRQLDVRLLLIGMIAGQIAFSMVPDTAGRIGPSLELRSRIWRYSAVLFRENLPLGTGTGSARLEIYNSAEPELRILAGGEKRVDYLHSEPLTLIVENGIPGLLLTGFLFYWLFRRCGTSPQSSLLAAFLPVFMSDLPLATPLGALPAALFLGSYPPLGSKKIGIPALVPGLIAVASLWWAFAVISGYSALGRGDNASSEDLELACRMIPWEERAFLAAGHSHLRDGSVLAALDDSERFVRLYPSYYRGWELRAAALSAAGRSGYSSWARAALLLPEEIYTTERYLLALNGINPQGMYPDSACMIAGVLTRSRENLAEVEQLMTPSELVLSAGKMLALSSFCRGHSDSLAARSWFNGLAFASESGEQLPVEMVMGFFQSQDLYEYLPWDWGPKADEYLNELRERLGMDPIADPSPVETIE